MKFADHLSKADIQKVNQLRHTSKNKKERKAKQSKQSKHKREEKLSNKDILELMGTNRDTYKRVGGAVRRR